MHLNIKFTLTIGHIVDAIRIYNVLIHMAYGNISPKITKKVVEITIASQAGTILCKNTGNPFKKN